MDVEPRTPEAETPDGDEQFPFRSGPRYLAGFVAFALVILFAGIVTGHAPAALLAGFALWLAAVLVTHFVAR
jgi:hypothetical protein